MERIGIPDGVRSLSAGLGLRFCRAANRALVVFAGLAVLLALTGCKKDAAAEAAESDANGYLCLKCEAKLYTERSVFIGPKCPKCSADALTEVVGYVCPKDKHVTLRGRVDDRGMAAECDSCKGPLGGMVLPREKDLKAWGAAKVSS